jgi:hypothetical protein
MPTGACEQISIQSSLRFAGIWRQSDVINVDIAKGIRVENQLEANLKER